MPADRVTGDEEEEELVVDALGMVVVRGRVRGGGWRPQPRTAPGKYRMTNAQEHPRSLVGFYRRYASAIRVRISVIAETRLSREDGALNEYFALEKSHPEPWLL